MNRFSALRHKQEMSKADKHASDDWCRNCGRHRGWHDQFYGCAGFVSAFADFALRNEPPSGWRNHEDVERAMRERCAR